MSSTHAIPTSDALSPTDVLSNYMTATHANPGGVLSAVSGTTTKNDYLAAFPSPPRYRPAYMLKEDHLERAGRGLSIPA